MFKSKTFAFENPGIFVASIGEMSDNPKQKFDCDVCFSFKLKTNAPLCYSSGPLPLNQTEGETINPFPIVFHMLHCDASQLKSHFALYTCRRNWCSGQTCKMSQHLAAHSPLYTSLPVFDNLNNSPTCK